MINRSIPPTIHDAISFDFELPSVHKIDCPNGIPLYWLKAGAQEVVEITLAFKAGIWQESQPGVAQAVAALLKNGTSTRSSLEINEAIEFYGATLKVSANNDWAFVSLYCLSKHVSQLLPTVKEVIADAAFQVEELEIYQQNSAQRLELNLLQCDFVANRNIDALLFGKEHPYGRYTELKDIQALNSSLLRKFHQQYYIPKNCKLFVSGNFEDKALEAIVSAFGSDNWTQEVQILPAKLEYLIKPSGDRTINILNDPKGVQAAIRMARAAPTRHDPAFPELFVMNTIFGGYFGSRLMANIREDKGYTYGIHSSLMSFQHAGVLMIGTEAGKDVSEQTVLEVKKEMKIMREELVDDEELLLVKNYLLGSILGDLDGPFSIMQRWKNLILNKQSVTVFDRNISVYKNIKPETIRTLAQQYLNEDSFYELVVI